tara:strand:+ start:124 stop:426 length:303 start_codon:yes stop_codon:yes gene_type:complete
MSDNRNLTDIKKFIIKLVAVTFAIIVVINVTYNLIFADKLENINKLLLLNKKENIESLKDKVRSELKQGLEKDQILNKEDKMLIYKFYLKIKNEFKDIEN